MEEILIQIKNDAVGLIIETSDKDDLQKIKENFLGKNGRLTLAIKDIAHLPADQRPEIGRLANEIKNTLEDLLNDKLEAKKILEKEHAKTEKKQEIDYTLPGVKPPLGHLHLITQAIEEISTIFENIGFTRRAYPEIEWDHYAFGALNFPDSHPARDDWETFFVDAKPNTKYGPMLLTPHTSSGQIREMEAHKPPIRMLNIAKCYRRQSDVSHAPMFHQFETLVIDEGISIKHLKGVLDYFAKSYFGEDRVTRIRPYHFQFTEPSFEVDISCGVCGGKGCKLCKEGWLEIGGAGMVHPNVLKSAGLDPEKYSGFASGWGVERVLMMKSGLQLDDLRILYSNNLDFLEQF